MTRLRELRKRLARLRRRRRRVRLGTGFSAILLAVLWIAGVVFLVDWLFEMSRAQRSVALLASAAAAIWAFRRFTLPWLGHRETELDMALLVQGQEHIDSDLVAAVQFESPEAPEWGSVQLEQAVIEQVATTGKRLNVMRGLSRKQLTRRTILLILTAAAWAGLGYRFTDHLTAFVNRFFLLSAVHYPTKTIIDAIVIKSHPPMKPQPALEPDPIKPRPAVAPDGNELAAPREETSDPPIDWTDVQGRPVDPTDPGKAPMKILYGHHVRFEVQGLGEIPAEGRAVLTAPRSGLRETIRLQPIPGRPGVFAGEKQDLREPLRYQFYLGDAWTDPAMLTVTQLPVVDVELEVQPPPYAVTDRETTSIAMPLGLRQISVIEGSRVVVKVRSASSLDGAALTVLDRTTENRSFPFRKAEQPPGDDPRELWILDSDDSPLRTVTELTRYQIDVTDTDGQHLEEPIIGVVRIQTDAPPRIAAAIITRWVLPTARPTIYYEAIDDYGVARVTVDCEVAHADGTTERREFEAYPFEPGDPPRRHIEPKSGYAFDLSRLDLKKGDSVTATLTAIDFRGERAGKSASADPLVFQVTDEQGILASMMETDRHSARQLKTMIQRQLGIGESL